MSIKLILSPLQGFTDYRFRSAFSKYFTGIDSYYTPYIRLNGKLDISPAFKRDILHKSNSGLEVVPQIMTKSADEFLYVAKYIQKLGYGEINWNLGCPYPMVTNRGLGSGLLREPEKIEDILGKVFSESDIAVSLKVRLGYDNNKEIFRLLPLLENYPIKSLSIHPRIGTQLYKGDVDLRSFERCLESSSHTICYNGDITSVEIFNNLAKRFPRVNHWLIGRGVIADPFLPGMIKSNSTKYPENSIDIFTGFHNNLFLEYEQSLSGAGHVIMKMFSFWKYFIYLFPDSKKGLKKIKKAKTLSAYNLAVREILDFNNI